MAKRPGWFASLVCLFFWLGTLSASAWAQEIVADASGLGAASPQNIVVRWLFGGSIFGDTIVVLILLLSLLTVYLIVDHAFMITRNRILPRAVVDELERLILHGEIQRAILLCQARENYSLATECIHAGLERFHNSEFGFAEYRSAVEEAGEDQTGKLYRRTEGLSVIGAVAPMLGLLGTVLGMIESFETIASQAGLVQPQDLAGGIGEALITTLLGLMVAIPAMIALSYFRNKIDSLVSEAGKRVERVMMPLGRKKPKAAPGLI